MLQRLSVSAWPCNPRALCKQCSALNICMNWGQSLNGAFLTLPKFVGFFPPQDLSKHKEPVPETWNRIAAGREKVAGKNCGVMLCMFPLSLIHM